MSKHISKHIFVKTNTLEVFLNALSMCHILDTFPCVVVRKLPNSILGGCLRTFGCLCVVYACVIVFFINRWKILFTQIQNMLVHTDSFGSFFYNFCKSAMSHALFRKILIVPDCHVRFRKKVIRRR